MRSSLLDLSSFSRKSSMYPSSFKTRAMDTLSVDEGMLTSVWPTIWALRMRVSMSAIGSLMLIRLSLPACLNHTRDGAVQRHIAQLVAPETELAKYTARTARDRATISQPCRRRITRQFLQPLACLVLCLVGLVS